ncbi:MAG: glycerophosphodiester phosphodiesterase [Pseudomonadota bacterium]
MIRTVALGMCLSLLLACSNDSSNSAASTGTLQGMALTPAQARLENGVLQLRMVDNANSEDVVFEDSIAFENSAGGIAYEFEVPEGSFGISMLVGDESEVDWSNLPEGALFRHYHCDMSDASMPCRTEGVAVVAGERTTLNLTLGLNGFTGNLFDGDQFLNVAHGAGQRERPDFTFAAYEHLQSIAAEVIFEADLNGSADGVPVVMHDSTLDRKTNFDEINCPDKEPAPEGTHFTHNDCGRISELTFDEIKTYDAGYHWSEDGGASFPYRDQGLRPVSLEELFQRFPDAHYVLELKPEERSGVRSFTDEDLATAAEVARLIRSYRMQDRVTVASFLVDLIQAFRAEDADIDTALAEDEVLPLMLAVFADDAGYQLPGNTGRFLQIPENFNFNGTPLNLVNEQNVAVLLERYGLKVHVWTINEREDLTRLLAVPGLAAIMTDYPQRLQNMIREAGL